MSQSISDVLNAARDRLVAEVGDGAVTPSRVLAMFRESLLQMAIDDSIEFDCKAERVGNVINMTVTAPAYSRAGETIGLMRASQLWFQHCDHALAIPRPIEG